MVLEELMVIIFDEVVCKDGDFVVVFVGVDQVLEWIYIVLFFVYNMMELMNFYVNVKVDVVELEGFI